MLKSDVNSTRWCLIEERVKGKEKGGETYIITILVEMRKCKSRKERIF